MNRYILSTDQWYQISRLLPTPRKRSGGPGRPVCDFFEVFQGILWVLVSGARWKDLPQYFPSYQTCHRRFQQWTKSGVFRALLIDVIRRANRCHRSDYSETYIDGSFIPAKRGGALIRRSIKGKGSKISVLIDRKHVLHSIEMSSANTHDMTMLPLCLAHRFTRKKPERIVGDKAYDSDPMDRELKKQHIELIAPDRDCKKKFTQDRRPLRRIKRRWTVERYFARIKNYRRVAIRWERKPENYFAMVCLACFLTSITGF